MYTHCIEEYCNMYHQRFSYHLQFQLNILKGVYIYIYISPILVFERECLTNIYILS